MRGLLALLAAVLVMALAGCGERADDTTRDEPDQPEATMSETAEPKAVRAAIDDLAEREGVDPSEVSLVSREEVTWRDGSLGCAEPGMAYTQALVPGSRIVLSVGGRSFEYHSGGRREPFLCKRPTQ